MIIKNLTIKFIVKISLKEILIINGNKITNSTSKTRKTKEIKKKTKLPKERLNGNLRVTIQKSRKKPRKMKMTSMVFRSKSQVQIQLC